MSGAGPIRVAALGGVESPARTAALGALAVHMNTAGSIKAPPVGPQGEPVHAAADAANASDRDAIEQALGLPRGALVGHELADLSGKLAEVREQLDGGLQDRAQIERTLGLAPGVLSRASV